MTNSEDIQLPWGQDTLDCRKAASPMPTVEIRVMGAEAVKNRADVYTFAFSFLPNTAQMV
ncbi:MAG: hypothetical protein HQK58_13570 [Deltaproteobacteria bacterium]|nr:hypothetical protein [Deltaproteobacteria bacterium]